MNQPAEAAMTTTPEHPALLNANLIQLNTMRLTCIAERLIVLDSESDIEATIAHLQLLGSPIFILSGGSNVILPRRLNAAVIQPAFKGISILDEDSEQISLEVMAGENWHNFVTYTVHKGWYGLENLALIPGLVGASPVQNIGAYGVQLEDYLTYVIAYHLPTQSWHRFTKADCEFGYRDSKFKREAGQWLITRVAFTLHKDPHKFNTNYGDVAKLAQQLADKNQQTDISPLEIMQAVIEIRQTKLPDPQNLPNCGSFFKNPIIDSHDFLALQQSYPEIVGYTVDQEHTKVAAGWLIDAAGLKGKGIEPILTHKNQALVLVNHSPKDTDSPASQDDILATQQYIQSTVATQFSINLEREPVWLDSSANYI